MNNILNDTTNLMELDWLDLQCIGHPETVAIGNLPGYRYRDVKQNLQTDLDSILRLDISYILILCTKEEMKRYKVKNLTEKYNDNSIWHHHLPFDRGDVPDIFLLAKMFKVIETCIKNGGKILIHCVSGVGRSSVVAVCLMLYVMDYLSVSEAIDKMRQIKGPAAIPTIKQYNFVHEFRKLWGEYMVDHYDLCRPISR